MLDILDELEAVSAVIDLAPTPITAHYSEAMRGAIEAITRLRSELEAVKREAVEVLKPFSFLGLFMDSGALHHPDTMHCPVGEWGSVAYGTFRAARAFVEKHGRDGK